MGSRRRRHGQTKEEKVDREVARITRRAGEPTELCPVCDQELPISTFPRLFTGEFSVSRGCIPCRTTSRVAPNR